MMRCSSCVIFGVQKGASPVALDPSEITVFGADFWRLGRAEGVGAGVSSARLRFLRLFPCPDPCFPLGGIVVSQGTRARRRVAARARRPSRARESVRLVTTWALPDQID